MSGMEPGAQEDTSTERAFNFTAMTDDQIASLGRAIILAIDYECDEATSSEPGDADGLLSLFTQGMTFLIARSPDRAKALLKRGALSDNAYDEEATVVCAPALAWHDFELARDIVLYVQGSDHDVSGIVMGAAGEIADHATLERAAELRAAVEAVNQATERIVPPGLSG